MRRRRTAQRTRILSFLFNGFMDLPGHRMYVPDALRMDPRESLHLAFWQGVVVVVVVGPVREHGKSACARARDDTFTRSRHGMPSTFTYPSCGFMSQFTLPPTMNVACEECGREAGFFVSGAIEHIYCYSCLADKAFGTGETIPSPPSVGQAGVSLPPKEGTRAHTRVRFPCTRCGSYTAPWNGALCKPCWDAEEERIHAAVTR